MYLPTLEGIIDRCILVHYRVDPVALQRLLPAPFQPKPIGGMGITGICLIRLTHLRPRSLPELIGVSSSHPWSVRTPIRSSERLLEAQ